MKLGFKLNLVARPCCPFLTASTTDLIPESFIVIINIINIIIHRNRRLGNPSVQVDNPSDTEFDDCTKVLGHTLVPTVPITLQFNTPLVPPLPPFLYVVLVVMLRLGLGVRIGISGLESRFLRFFCRHSPTKHVTSTE